MGENWLVKVRSSGNNFFIIRQTIYERSRIRKLVYPNSTKIFHPKFWWVTSLKLEKVAIKTFISSPLIIFTPKQDFINTKSEKKNSSHGKCGKSRMKFFYILSFDGFELENSRTTNKMIQRGVLTVDFQLKKSTYSHNNSCHPLSPSKSSLKTIALENRFYRNILSI